MNLLVGATGFVGGHLVEYLFQQGEISKGLFRKGSHLKILDTNGVQGIEGDVLDHHSLHEAMEGVETVFNLASPMPGEDSEFMKVNTEGILNLLEVANEAKAKNFVHLSTLDVYGFDRPGPTPQSPSPSNEYQRAKAESERLLIEHSKRNPAPRVLIVRSARAIGSRDRTFVSPVLRMAKEGKVVLPDAGEMSFSHPKDIAQSMLKAANGASQTGTVFQVKSFDAQPLALARSLVERAGLAAEVRKQGMFGGTGLPDYTAKQLKTARRIGDQPSWKSIGYVPAFDAGATCDEVAKWYKKDPWEAEDH